MWGNWLPAMFSETVVITLPCQHLFHRTCIQNQANVKNSDPKILFFNFFKNIIYRVIWGRKKSKRGISIIFKNFLMVILNSKVSFLNNFKKYLISLICFHLLKMIAFNLVIFEIFIGIEILYICLESESMPYMQNYYFTYNAYQGILKSTIRRS